MPCEIVNVKGRALLRIRRLDYIAILMLLKAAFNVLLRPPLRRLPVTSSITAISATFSATFSTT